MKQGFLQRINQPNKPLPLSSMIKREQESQLFLTNPAMTNKLRSLVPLPPINQSHINKKTTQQQLQQAKEMINTLTENTNQLKLSIQKLRCQHRQLSCKIKYIKIKGQSQIKKMETITSIDFQYLKKNWINNSFDQSVWQYVGKALEDQHNQATQVNNIARSIQKRVCCIEQQIG